MQRPSALGLMLCDQVIIDRDSGKPTLVGMFSGMACSQFPSPPQPIDVFDVLTDGQGRMLLKLVVIRLADDQQIASQIIEQEFRDPLQVVHVRYRLRTLSFPSPGQYVFELLADDESVCHCRLRVRSSEEMP